MQLVILASGRGKKMGDLTKTVPKPMLKIKGKPLLEHKLNALPREIKEIIFIVGYRGEHIMNHFKKSFNGRKISYIVQKNINATGAAVFLAKSFLGDRFMVMNGDDLYHKKDIKKLLKHDLAVLGCEVDDVSQFGVLQSNRGKNLIGLIEKPKKSKDKIANAGLYMLNKKLFNYELERSKTGEYYLTDLLVKMSKDHRIKVEKASLWFPVGNPKDLQKAEAVIHKFA